jgi:hypothetical protein
VPLAFCDAEKLAQDPDVDLVTVSMRVRPPGTFVLRDQLGKYALGFAYLSGGVFDGIDNGFG